jgi:hypothetical protein
MQQKQKEKDEKKNWSDLGHIVCNWIKPNRFLRINHWVLFSKIFVGENILFEK